MNLGGERVAESAEEKIMRNLKTIEEWALQGMSQKDMAECLGVGESTFRKVKKQNVALLAVLKQCANTRKKIEEEQVKSVERSVFERAKGYEQEVTRFFKVKRKGVDEKGNKYEIEEVVERVEVERVPADIGAAKFFLMNKAKETWQDNPYKVENDKAMLKMKKNEHKRLMSD